MSRRAHLPYDVRQECLWIVRGYERRVRAYHEARSQIIYGASCYAGRGRGRAQGNDCPVENRMERLQIIEHLPETQRMRAVEQAVLQIGLDLDSEELRQRLTTGILLNCTSRNDYPFRLLNLPEFSERDFYRRKDAFLVEIARYLGIL